MNVSGRIPRIRDPRVDFHDYHPVTPGRNLAAKLRWPAMNQRPKKWDCNASAGAQRAAGPVILLQDEGLRRNESQTLPRGRGRKRQQLARAFSGQTACFCPAARKKLAPVSRRRRSAALWRGSRPVPFNSGYSRKPDSRRRDRDSGAACSVGCTGRMPAICLCAVRGQHALPAVLGRPVYLENDANVPYWAKCLARHGASVRRWSLPSVQASARFYPDARSTRMHGEAMEAGHLVVEAGGVPVPAAVRAVGSVTPSATG
jgi:hypothetical protein